MHILNDKVTKLEASNELLSYLITITLTLLFLFAVLFLSYRMIKKDHRSKQEKMVYQSEVAATRRCKAHGLSHQKLFHHLLDIATEWHNIGVLLGISSNALKKIEIDQRNQSNSCLREMLDEWLNQIDPEPTLGHLIRTVECFNQRKARELKDLIARDGVASFSHI